MVLTLRAPSNEGGQNKHNCSYPPNVNQTQVLQTCLCLLPSPRLRDHLADFSTAQLPCQGPRFVPPPRGLDHDGTASAEIGLSDAALARAHCFLYPLDLLYLPAEFVGQQLHLSPVTGRKEQEKRCQDIRRETLRARC